MNNLELRGVLNDNIRLCKDIRAKITHSRQQSFSELMGRREYEKCIREMRAMIKIVDDVLSDKEKIPRNTEHLMHAIAAVTNSPLKFATMYLTARVKNIELLRNYITTKHIRNVRKRRCRLKVFKPWDRDSAIYADYYGIRCEDCNSWCVRQHPTTSGLLECADCGNVQKIRGYPRCKSCQVPIYDDAIKKIFTTGSMTCPGCGEGLSLPDSMFSFLRKKKRKKKKKNGSGNKSNADKRQ